MEKTTSSNKIERAHQMYRDARYADALGFYTDAIAVAKTKPQKIALHSNRAACYLKLHDFKKAAEECTSVLELDQKHSGALMLRAQTLVTLKEYHSALFDVNRLLELNPSSEVYQNLQTRLRTQLSLAPIPESEEEFEEEGEEFEDNTEVILEVKTKTEEAVGDKFAATSNIRRDQKIQLGKGSVSASQETVSEFSSKQGTDKNNEPEKATAEATVSKAPNGGLSQQQIKGRQTIPKPKGHSALDYSRWDSVEDDSSEEDNDDDEDEESLPQYRFRVKTIGVRPVK